MSDITVRGAIDKLRELNNDITAKIKDFERATGFSVHTVELERAGTIGQVTHRVVGVNVRVEIG
jgi:hypothetical protein